MAMIASNGVDDPAWLFGATLILIVLLCFPTLFFLFRRLFRALVRQRDKSAVRLLVASRFFLKSSD
jgi:hypothetical protein